MKSLAVRIGLVFALLALAASAHAKVYELKAAPDSRLWLEGDSTLHAYSSSATQVSVDGRFDAPASPQDAMIGGAVREALLDVPVKALKSGENKLDKKLYEALRAEANPDIRFHMTGYRLGEPGSLSGTLSVAGRERPVEIPVSIDRTPDGIRVRGAYPLLMTDYGVKPPTMLGLLRTNNKVVIKFDLDLKAVQVDGPKAGATQ
jgi:polyisoprenoid-binding protein YceI